MNPDHVLIFFDKSIEMYNLIHMASVYKMPYVGLANNDRGIAAHCDLCSFFNIGQKVVARKLSKELKNPYNFTTVYSI